jgi:hypothetical protein
MVILNLIGSKKKYFLFTSTALKLLYRARYLALMVIGENHPEIALVSILFISFSAETFRRKL